MPSDGWFICGDGSAGFTVLRIVAWVCIVLRRVSFNRVTSSRVGSLWELECSPERLRVLRVFLNRKCWLDYGFLELGLILHQGEIHIVIFGLAPNAQSPRFQTRKEHPNELSKAGRIQDCYPFRRTSGCIIGINAPSWYRAFPLRTNLTQPR